MTLAKAYRISFWTIQLRTKCATWQILWWKYTLLEPAPTPKNHPILRFPFYNSPVKPKVYTTFDLKYCVSIWGKLFSGKKKTATIVGNIKGLCSKSLLNLLQFYRRDFVGKRIGWVAGKQTARVAKQIIIQLNIIVLLLEKSKTRG